MAKALCLPTLLAAPLLENSAREVVDARCMNLAQGEKRNGQFQAAQKSLYWKQKNNIHKYVKNSSYVGFELRTATPFSHMLRQRGTYNYQESKK